MPNYPDELNTRKAEKAVSFYHQKMSSYTLYHNGKEVILPVNENYILVGINNPKTIKSTAMRQYTSFSKRINDSDTSVKIYIVSLLKNIEKKTINGIPIYSYKSEALGAYFKISDTRNFVLFVNSINEIEFFDYYLLPVNEINLLIEGIIK